MTQSATRRALGILELLVDQPQGLGLSELGSQLGMPKSIAHRLLALLTECGFVRQDAVTERYGLTLKLALLGARYLAGTGLGDVSQPILERLAAATGELARLTVVEGEGLAWVGKAQGARHGLRYDPDAGHARRAARHGDGQGVARDPARGRGPTHRPGYRLCHAGPFRPQRDP